VHDEQGRPVGVPRRADLARQVQGKLVLSSGGDVPHQQRRGAVALVLHQQPGVTLDGGEAERFYALARSVPQVGDHPPVQPEHPQGHVPGVAVLAVPDRHQRPVPGQVGDVRVLRVLVERAHLVALVARARAQDVDAGAPLRRTPKDR
jgi:hypothetical protein